MPRASLISFNIMSQHNRRKPLQTEIAIPSSRSGANTNARKEKAAAHQRIIIKHTRSSSRPRDLLPLVSIGVRETTQRPANANLLYIRIYFASEQKKKQQQDRAAQIKFRGCCCEISTSFGQLIAAAPTNQPTHTSPKPKVCMCVQESECNGGHLLLAITRWWLKGRPKLGSRREINYIERAARTCWMRAGRCRVCASANLRPSQKNNTPSPRR